MHALHRRSPAFRGALLSLIYLGGGLVLAFPASALTSRLAAAWGVPLGPALLTGTLLVCCAAGGALWAGHVARAFGHESRSRYLAAYGALGFGVAGPASLFALTSAEGLLLERAQGGATVPMHLAFGAVFPATTFVVVFGTVLALGTGARLRARAFVLALRCAAAAALAFLSVAALMDAAGWRVGAPGAEARFTMVVVTALGLIAATVAGGATLGRRLATAQLQSSETTRRSGASSHAPPAGGALEAARSATVPPGAEQAT